MNRSKLVHKWLNLGSQRGTFRPDAPLVHRTCPYCATPEDFAHLLSCEDPRARKAQYDAMTKLRKAINGTPAAAPLLRVIKQWTATPSEQIDLAPGVDIERGQTNAAERRRRQTDKRTTQTPKGGISTRLRHSTSLKIEIAKYK